MLRYVKALGLCLSLIALPAVNAAVGESLIGLYSDTSAEHCGADAVPFSPCSVYVIAVLDNSISGLTAAEFRIENLPAAGGGQITPHWESTLIIGSIADGLAIAFTTAQTGDANLLGRIDFMPVSDGWLGTDHRLLVKEGLIGETELEVDKRLLAEQQQLEFKEELQKKQGGGQERPPRPRERKPRPAVAAGASVPRAWRRRARTASGCSASGSGSSRWAATSRDGGSGRA
jgi:hypothetical protein